MKESKDTYKIYVKKNLKYICVYSFKKIRMITVIMHPWVNIENVIELCVSKSEFTLWESVTPHGT